MASGERRHGPGGLPGVLGNAFGFAYLVLGLNGLAAAAGWGAVVTGPHLGTGFHLFQVAVGLLRIVLFRVRDGLRAFGGTVLVTHLALLAAATGILGSPLDGRIDLGWPANAAYLVGAMVGIVLVTSRGSRPDDSAGR
ncbi:hypothetical protein GCM10012275_05160 [Longimycelium tulufanense]|uniref:Uncharacterized protein n=1 Tax=Longimycelium tulufanense TaxID=907463 RepID=A0A8J3CA32_9PSEU|nr:hypothetical protein [Longimycelium tulufanense]GGM36987.1 hypothetical protein GCM10012275_05160 [Longimycelium tulufanense]